jgi:hypothetical protein
MGNSNNKLFIYTLAATFLVLLVLVLSGGKKQGSVLSLFSGTQKATTRTDFMKVPSAKYAVSRYNIQNNGEKTYKNEYKPSSTYARTYTAPEENTTPLVASTKFIRKQDKLKKAKKRSNKLLAKNKKKKSSQSSTNNDEDDFFSDDEDLTSELNRQQVVSGGAASNARKATEQKKEEEKSVNSVEYWEKPIFIEEDFKAVVKLIESYQIRKVSNTVFYTLVDDMTNDERPHLREYGLVALSATPSAKSFTELARMKHTDTTTDLRSTAGKEISNYTHAGRVSYVVGALRSSTENTPKATLEALSTLTQTSKKYSSLVAQSNGGEKVDMSGIEQLEPRLGNALLLIQEKYANSPDPKIKSEADKTVAAINDFITL